MPRKPVWFSLFTEVVVGLEPDLNSPLEDDPHPVERIAPDTLRRCLSGSRIGRHPALPLTVGAAQKGNQPVA